MTNIASRFSRVLTEDNACQTVHDLRIDKRNALETFRAVDDQLRPLLEAAEANALPTEKPNMSRTVSEDIINSAEYITSAEDMLFEAHADISRAIHLRHRISRLRLRRTSQSLADKRCPSVL